MNALTYRNPPSHYALVVGLVEKIRDAHRLELPTVVLFRGEEGKYSAICWILLFDSCISEGKITKQETILRPKIYLWSLTQ